MQSIGPEVYRCEAAISWDGKTGGSVKSRRFELFFDMPEEFGGLGRSFCPDELFLSSVGCCLITTFLSFRRRFNLTINRLEARVEGEIKLLGAEGYRVKSIKVKLEASTSEDEVDRVKRYLELAKEYCHITRSIEGCIPTDVQIEVSSS
ncbi:MAG: OsmC family protein [Nitrososphaerales archaeon]